jgi:hypothetical protein
VGASLGWRERLRKSAAVVFFREPKRLAVYQDHNESGTIEEELSDLRTLVGAAEGDLARLSKVGFGDGELGDGRRLLAQADGRDVLAVLGIQNQADLKAKRDKLLTFAVELGRYARACAALAFITDPETARRLQKVSFRNALRRIRPLRPQPKDEPEAPETPEPATAAAAGSVEAPTDAPVAAGGGRGT